VFKTVKTSRQIVQIVRQRVRESQTDEFSECVRNYKKISSSLAALYS